MIGKIKSVKKEVGRIIVELIDSKYKIIFESPVKDFYTDIKEFNLAAKDSWVLNKDIKEIYVVFSELKSFEDFPYVYFHDMGDLYMTLIKKKEFDDVIELFLMLEGDNKTSDSPMRFFMWDTESIKAKSFPVSIYIEE